MAETRYTRTLIRSLLVVPVVAAMRANSEGESIFGQGGFAVPEHVPCFRGGRVDGLIVQVPLSDVVPPVM